MHRAHPRLKIRDRKSPGIHGAVPSDDIERAVRIGEALSFDSALHPDLPDALVERTTEARAHEIAVAVRRIHAKLPGWIAETTGDADAARKLHEQEVLRSGRLEHEPVQQALRQEDVV